MLSRIFILVTLISCTTLPPEEKSDREGVEVIEVNVSGVAGNYRFSVTLKSPDTGCDQYADWWEVISEDGKLLGRRNMGHSHVDEQPFTRTGSDIDIESTQIIIIRGHMNNLGYGTSAMKGSVMGGFTNFDIDSNQFSELAEEAPLPPKCAF